MSLASEMLEALSERVLEPMSPEDCRSIHHKLLFIASNVQGLEIDNRRMEVALNEVVENRRGEVVSLRPPLVLIAGAEERA